LPLGATNGEWSARLAESMSSTSHDIDDIIERDVLVVRALVLSEHERHIHRYRYGDGSQFNLHTIYRIVILEVFNGDWEVGDIRPVMQFKRLGHPEQRHAFGLYCANSLNIERIERRMSSEIIRVPIDIGDDLILILGRTVSITSPEMRRLDTVFGIYYYTPEAQRGGHENYSFKPVNPHNNRTLTEADLYQLRNRTTSALVN